MEDSGNNYGVKIIGAIVSVEKINEIDASKIASYDFIIQDRLAHSYNGNDDYVASISCSDGSTEWKLTNGWSIKQFRMPGDWFGQYVHVILADSFGTEIDYFSEITGRYYNTSSSMLRDAIKKAMDFANNNMSVQSYRLLEGLSMKISCDNSIGDKASRLRKFSEKLLKFIEDMESFETQYKDNDEILEKVNSQLKVHLDIG